MQFIVAWGIDEVGSYFVDTLFTSVNNKLFIYNSNTKP